MLGLDVLKSPAELHEDLMNKGFLEYSQQFCYNSDYQRSYDWLVSKVQERSPHHSHHDHPHILLLFHQHLFHMESNNPIYGND